MKLEALASDRHRRDDKSTTSSGGAFPSSNTSRYAVLIRLRPLQSHNYSTLTFRSPPRSAAQWFTGRSVRQRQLVTKRAAKCEERLAAIPECFGDTTSRVVARSNLYDTAGFHYVLFASFTINVIGSWTPLLIKVIFTTTIMDRVETPHWKVKRLKYHS